VTKAAQPVDEGGPSLAAWITRGSGFAIGVAAIVGLLALANAAGGVLILLFLAIILAGALEPVVAWIRGRLPIGRGPTILLVYGVFLVSVVGLALVAVPVAAAQLDATMHRLPPFIDQARTWASEVRPQVIGQSITALLDAGSRIVSPPVSTAPTTGQVVQVGLTVAEAVISTLTLLTLVYFWLVEHARLQRYVLAFVPAESRAGSREIWNHVEERLGLWVRGQLILMAAMGTATTIAYTILGVPGALILGLIAAITEAIPLVGPLLGAIPAVLVAATVSPQLALVVAGVYIVLQFLEGNVLVPTVMRNTVGISPFLVILSLLVGGAVGGLVGAMLAVPIAAAIEILIEGLQAREVPVAQDPTPEASPAEDDEEAAPPAGAREAGAET
jgi:predicted PurR-regulated permease PerM